MHFLSDAQKRALLENPNVEEITEKQIHFKAAFKINAVERYLEGKSPDDIFKDAGIPIEFFEERYCYYTLKKWKVKYQNEGKDSLRENKAGLGSIGRPKDKNLKNLSYEELQAIVQIQREIIKDLELKKKMALAKKK